ncbi:hypothetical protein [Pantoea endophytica]|uniref:hypothetical protein n=1 Tax=Pantoea endophytica TaxID=92488 RepID=UPI001AE82ADF|nr:hypothetical protein [Pantoea endophytica]
MAQNIQHSQRSASSLQHEAEDELIALHSDNESSLDELEFRERHGEHYTLRHHLSGCAQTLYTVDFAQDFQATAVESYQPLLIPEGEGVTMTLNAGLNAPVVEPVTAALQPTSAEASITPIEGHSIVAESPTIQLNAAHAETDVMTQTPSPLSNGDAATMTLPEVSSSQTVAEINAHTPTLITDFNDGTLGGWNLGGDLSVDQVLEEGQLHFSADYLANGQAVLSQSMALVADQSYQFQMSVHTADGSQPSQFMLNVNGESHPMEVVHMGDNYILRVAFVAPHVGNASMSIVPMGDTKGGSDVWLDDVIVMPVAPQVGLPIEMSLMLAEPTFDFAQLESEPSPPTAPAIHPIALSMVLQNVEPSLFAEIEHAVMPTSESVLLSAEAVMDVSHNMEANSSDMPMIFAETTQIEPLPLGPDFT